MWHLNSAIPPNLLVKARVQTYVDKELVRAANYFDGQGLQHGIDWDATLFIIRNSKKENLCNFKSVLESIMSACMWPSDRIHSINSNVSNICPRCGQQVETSWHVYYGCRCNALIESEAVQSTQQLCHQALTDTGNECLWLRGLLPASFTRVPTRTLGSRTYKCKIYKPPNRFT